MNCIERLSSSTNFFEQAEIVKQIKESGQNALPLLVNALALNPFLKLTSEDRRCLAEASAYGQSRQNLVLLRQVASSVPGRRFCVFCMPKSGSSFVQSAIQYATGSQFVSLTGFVAPGRTSFFGMNDREQEFDEYAILYNIFLSAGNFVSQHHTKATAYLFKQLEFYAIRPIVTIRNIFDCIVSADDMYYSWAKECPSGEYPTSPYSLPFNYIDLDKTQRVRHLSYTLGIWLVNFYLSWKRALGSLRHDCVIVYENDILSSNITEKLTKYMNLSPDESLKLNQYVQSPDKQKSRFNKGVAGRGAEIPDDVKRMLMDYAEKYTEFSDDDRFLLFENKGR